MARKIWIDQCLHLAANDLSLLGLGQKSFKADMSWNSESRGQSTVLNIDAGEDGSFELNWTSDEGIVLLSTTQTFSSTTVRGGCIVSKSKIICGDCGMLCDKLMSKSPGERFQCRTCTGARYRRNNLSNKTKRVLDEWSARMMVGPDGKKRTAILIGQSPSNKSDPEKPLFGPSGQRLAHMVGMTIDDLMIKFKCINLIDFFPGNRSGGKGDLFPRMEAKSAAKRLAMILSGHRVVCLGKEVSRAFGVADLEWFEWTNVEGPAGEFMVATFPHPSGVSNWWNKKENRDRAMEWLRDLAYIPWLS